MLIAELDAMDPVPEEVALDAFVARLQADPTLARAVKTWVTWDGDPEDAGPPTADMTPWVRITAEPDPAGCARVWDNPVGGSTDVPIAIKVECAIVSAAIRARMRFWDLVRTAALPTGAAKLAGRQAFAAVGIRDVLMTRSGYGIDRATAAEGEELIVSEGRFSLILSVET